MLIFCYFVKFNRGKTALEKSQKYYNHQYLSINNYASDDINKPARNKNTPFFRGVNILNVLKETK